MKKIFLLCLLSLTFSYSTKSHACSDFTIESAEKNLQDAEARAKVGVASNKEVLLVEKHLLNLKLCKNATDFAAYKALATNTVKLLEIAKSSYAVGVNIKEDLVRAENEFKMQQSTCKNDLLPITKLRYNAGTIGPIELKNLEEACAILK